MVDDPKHCIFTSSSNKVAPISGCNTSLSVNEKNTLNDMDTLPSEIGSQLNRRNDMSFVMKNRIFNIQM